MSSAPGGPLVLVLLVFNPLAYAMSANCASYSKMVFAYGTNSLPTSQTNQTLIFLWYQFQCWYFLIGNPNSQWMLEVPIWNFKVFSREKKSFSYDAYFLGYLLFQDKKLTLYNNDGQYQFVLFTLIAYHEKKVHLVKYRRNYFAAFTW